MHLNKKDDSEKAHRLACNIYKARIKALARAEFPSPKFQHAFLELLYHEVELHRLSEMKSLPNLVNTLIGHLDYALGEFYHSDGHDSYLQMLEDITFALKQDEELKSAIGEYGFQSLLEKLISLQSTLPEHRRIDVFISYNSKDKAAIEEWDRQLRDAGIATWLDEWDIPKFGSWMSELEKAINETNAAAIFIGPSGVGPWQKQEIQALLQQAQHRPLRMGCVLLPECPDPIEESSIFLSNFQRVDLRQKSKNIIDELIFAITGKRNK
jgi:hypothetical protein